MSHILSYYGINLRQINHYHLTGCCPIHKGDNPNAFHVDLKGNLFNCFTHCGGGSIFDFVMKKERLSFYPAAMKIWHTFCLSHKQPLTHQNAKKCHPLPTIPRLNLQPDHTYLRKRNISPSLARQFQMGYCQGGIMKNRIAIPIINNQKSIVAYCGRAVQDGQTPKYLFPRNFKKSLHLFNIQSIKTALHQPVFIVEGFFDCIHIVRVGLNAIALMGSTISQQQLAMLKATRRYYILMLDGDETGRKASTVIEQKLKRYRIPFRTVHLIDVKEPEELDEDYLKMFTQR